jgi:hypothetical protein
VFDSTKGRLWIICRRCRIVAGGAIAAGAALVTGMTGLAFPLVALAATGAFAGGLTLHDLKPALRIPGRPTLRNWHAQWVQLRPSENVYGWSLRVPSLRGDIELEGQQALRALRRLLPRTNMFGAEPADTSAAADRVAHKGASDRFLQSVASRLGQEWYVDPRHNPLSIGAWGRARPYRIATALPILRLSLEMAVNELCEARFLEGDMVQLEREWAEAEELAAISDDLLMPGLSELTPSSS